MVQIIDEYRPQSLGERFGRAFSSASQQAAEQIPEYMLQRRQDAQQQDAQQRELEAQNKYAKSLGIDFEGMQNPELRKLAIQSGLQKENKAEEIASKLKSEESKLSRETREATAPLLAGLKTLERMRELRSEGELGRLSKPLSLLPHNTKKREARGEYERLGKSLISLASNIPIRNQEEFKTLAGNLYNPNITDAEAKGVLNAMEQIISQNLEQYSEANESGTLDSLSPDNARELRGAVVEDENGVKYRSDGTRWIRE